MTSRTCSSSRPSSRTCSARRGESSVRASQPAAASFRNGWRRTPSGCRSSRASGACMKTLLLVLSVFCARWAQSHRLALQQRPCNAVAAAAQRYGTLRRRLGNEGARGQHRVRAAVPAVVRRHEQAALDLSAARHRSMRRASMRGNFRSARVLWKEFSYDRRVETRFIERLADGSWRFAACGTSGHRRRSRGGRRCGAAVSAARRPLHRAVTQRLPGVP